MSHEIQDSLEEQLKLAKSPSTPHYILGILIRRAKKENPVVETILKRSDLTEKVFEALYDIKMFEEMAKHPNITSKMLEKLVRVEDLNMHGDTRNIIAAHPKITSKVVKTLLKTKNLQMYAKVGILLDNPAISSGDILRTVNFLINKWNKDWQSTYTPSKDDGSLSKHIDEMLEKAAKNHKTPRKALKMMFEQYTCLELIADHPNTDEKLRLRVKNQLKLRETALNPVIAVEEITKLASNPDKKVKQAILLNPSTSLEVCKKVIQILNRPERQEIAAQTKNQDLIDWFLSINDPDTHYKVFENLNISLETLEKYQNTTLEGVLFRIIANPSTPEAMVDHILKSHDHYNQCLVENGVAITATSEKILRKIYPDASITTLIGLAQNESTPKDILMEILSHSEPRVRAGLVKHHNLPEEIFSKLLEDDDFAVKRAILMNSVDFLGYEKGSKDKYSFEKPKMVVPITGGFQFKPQEESPEPIRRLNNDILKKYAQDFDEITAEIAIGCISDHKTLIFLRVAASANVQPKVLSQIKYIEEIS